MERTVFSVLSFLILSDAGMAQIRYGDSGWAQINHLEYERHFAEGRSYCSIQVRPSYLSCASPKINEGWLEQAGTQVIAGTVDLYIDHATILDHSSSNDSQTSLVVLYKELPSFGWNLGYSLGQKKKPGSEKILAPEEVLEVNSARTHLNGYILECGDALITTLTLEWQKLVDESMREAVRDMPKDIKDALIEERERRSGSAFTVPTEPRWLWHAEMQDFCSDKGTTTKIIGPAGPKLIRITGNNRSEINGALDSGGEDIFLINPHGIIVGPGEKVGDVKD